MDGRGAVNGDEMLDIQSMDLDARGIAYRDDGHRVVVAGALPGERVLVRTVKHGTHFDRAQLRAILRPSPQRVAPACAYFGVCGGCNMQHLEPVAQVVVKQRILEDLFQLHAGLRPETILPAIHGPSWGYRYRARLSVRLVPKKGGVLVGFRERNGSYVTDMHACKILPPRVSSLLLPLRRLVQSLSRPDRVPQIEVAVGDDGIVLVLRHVEPLTVEDEIRLRDFGMQYDVIWWLQAKGPDTVRPLEPQDTDAPMSKRSGRLSYTLPEYGLRMPFMPTDFTQVNPAINRTLVRRALTLLNPQAQDRVVDLFCGLGNFSLPLATLARQVVGIEGSAALTARATVAAAAHGLHHKTQFVVQDLFAVDASWLAALGRFERLLIDPPREGAEAVCLALAGLPATQRPQRIVYVSCNPTTLARDAAILAYRSGYHLAAAGVVNMFAHAGHVESMAVFAAV